MVIGVGGKDSSWKWKIAGTQKRTQFSGLINPKQSLEFFFTKGFVICMSCFWHASEQYTSPSMLSSMMIKDKHVLWPVLYCLLELKLLSPISHFGTKDRHGGWAVNVSNDISCRLGLPFYANRADIACCTVCCNLSTVQGPGTISDRNSFIIAVVVAVGTFIVLGMGVSMHVQ
jgi:hypothetical protein